MSFTGLMVANRSGRILAELEANIGSISWRLNKVGRVEFEISAKDPKATETNFRYGNRILFEFENGLPNWGGVIEPPRTWDRGIIKVTALSGEHLFKHRTTDKGRYFASASVGDIFRAVIDEANAIESMGVVLGRVWDSGNLHSPEYHYKDLLDIFQKSLTDRLSTADFDVVASESGGFIVFTANLYGSRGTSKSNYALIQDKNISRIKLREQGPIINSWDVAGEGTGWGDERLTANDQDDVSRGLYGLREDSRVYGDVSIQSTLNDHAVNLNAATKNPFNIFTLSAIDKAPARFRDYDLGDQLNLVAPDYGFGGTDTTIRIVGRAYDPDSGICDLVVQEVI